VGLALQKSAVDCVKEMPERYSSQADDDHAWITSITVNELQDCGNDETAHLGAISGT
jgi:hypothetical protein